MADTVHDLMSLAIATPDPRRVTNWIGAYLGKRPVEAKRDILRKFEAEFDRRQANADEKRAAGLVLRCVRRVAEEL